jgi:hypothetical protein
MTGNPYERFQSGALILRDELAVDRTLCFWDGASWSQRSSSWR